MENNDEEINEADLYINNVDVEEMSETDLESLKRKVKLIEKRIKEKNKPKTITISGSAHRKIKKMCTALNLNIGEWTEKTLLNRIEESCIEIDDRTHDEIQEESKNNIIEKYENDIKKTKILLKSNKLLMSKDLRFNGYSLLDAKPIYEYLGDDLDNFKEINYLKSHGIELNLIKTPESSNRVLYNTKLDDFVCLRP